MLGARFVRNLTELATMHERGDLPQDRPILGLERYLKEAADWIKKASTHRNSEFEAFHPSKLPLLHGHYK